VRWVLVKVLLALGLVVGGGGCAPKNPSAVGTYLNGNRDQAVADTRTYVRKDKQARALQLCRLASMLWATGDAKGADQALVQAVQIMQDFAPDGEFRAMVGQESLKQWKGEPYEKMMAFLTLGALRLASGDDGNALAMFKSAALADSGTAQERYRGDFIAAYALQSLAYRALREPQNAERMANLAVDTGWSRAMVGALGDAVARAAAQTSLPKGGEAAVAGLMAALPAGAQQAPRDPVEAARFARSQATDLLRTTADLPKKRRLPELSGFAGPQLRKGIEALDPLGQALLAEAAALPDSTFDTPRATESTLRAVLDGGPNVVLLVERGKGPTKSAEGAYSEQLRIVPGAAAPGPLRVLVDGRPADDVAWLDSVNWQATTRGGRAVDRFLRGKAVFKDVSGILGAGLLYGAGAAWASGDNQAAGALAIAGAITWLAGVFTNPAADTRAWELLPDSLHLVGLRLSPGSHTLEVDGRAYTVHVDGSDLQFFPVPQLVPGGSPVLGTPSP
jgi:hypothetical protein